MAKFYNMVENQFNKKIKHICRDNAPEFFRDNAPEFFMKDFFNSKGIIH